MNGQTLSSRAIEKYCREIEIKVNSHQLKKRTYPNMSSCGGNLFGYYDGDKLVYMIGFLSAEFGNVQTVFWIRDNRYYKIVERRHLPSVSTDDYCKTHITSSGQCDTKNIPYANTVTTILFSSDTVVTVAKSKRRIKIKDATKRAKDLVNCGESMKGELTEDIH